MIGCTFLTAFRKHLESRGCFGMAARVLLVDGPHDGRREAATIIRGRMECQGGVYLHVLGADDPDALYWVENPVIVKR